MLAGWGEPIKKLVVGNPATGYVGTGSAHYPVVRAAIAYLHNRLGGHGDIFCSAPKAAPGLARSTPAMAWGIATPLCGPDAS